MKSQECSFPSAVVRTGSRASYGAVQSLLRVTGVFLLGVGGSSSMDGVFWFEKMTERVEGRK